ncbi:MAG: type II toxin-antitoxin system Phd/YefM family antitoxin [Nitrospirae bacterium]|nr:type II toxin-antitoxin system Phd/YefM family antitoxin [Nitrospirota bacterium]
MRTVSATELARNFRAMLDSVEFKHEELVIIRNNHEVARIIPGPASMTALEAMADIFRTLPEDAGAGWLEDSRASDRILRNGVRDPWAT